MRRLSCGAARENLAILEGFRASASGSRLHGRNRKASLAARLFNTILFPPAKSLWTAVELHDHAGRIVGGSVVRLVLVGPDL